jgi:RNA polymerase sigma factor (sigma-70 family)
VVDPQVPVISLHCGDRDLAEKCTQEALLRACLKWRTVRGLTNPSGWVFGVAANLTADHYRRRSARNRAYELLADRIATVSRAGAEEHVDLIRALQELAVRQRQVLVMRYFLDMPLDEVGEALGMSPGAVRTMTHRAVSRLRTTLAPSRLCPAHGASLCHVTSPPSSTRPPRRTWRH